MWYLFLPCPSIKDSYLKWDLLNNLQLFLNKHFSSLRGKHILKLGRDKNKESSSKLISVPMTDSYVNLQVFFNQTNDSFV